MTKTMDELIKEADIFASCYSKDYVFHKGARPAESLKSDDVYPLSPAEVKRFTREAVDALTPEGIAKIKRLYQKRMLSIYQVEYCHPEIDRSSDVSLDIFDPKNDEILVNAGEMFDNPPKGRELPPSTSHKRVMRLFTGNEDFTSLSEYQDTFSRVGYYRLRDNTANSGSRTGPRYHLHFLLKELQKEYESIKKNDTMPLKTLEDE